MLFRTFPILLLFALVAEGQDIISARAGFVNYKHGQVTLPVGRDGKPLRQLEPGQSLSTGHGRAELLLTPGSFLRLDHESQVRVLSTRLDDVRLEVLSGTVTLEVNELAKGSSMAVAWREHSIPVRHTGLYRFEASPESLRIYVEKGKLELAGMKGALKSGKYVDLPGQGTLSAAMKYNRKDLDEFGRWNRLRGEELALASYSAANTFLRRPFGFRSSLWFLDPYLGFYTYLPYSYSVTSPFGFTFYCPRALYVYREPSHPGGGDSGPSVGARSGGYSGSSGASAPAAAPPPAAPSAPRAGAGGEGASRPSRDPQ